MRTGEFLVIWRIHFRSFLVELGCCSKHALGFLGISLLLCTKSLLHENRTERAAGRMPWSPMHRPAERVQRDVRVGIGYWEDMEGIPSTLVHGRVVSFLGRIACRFFDHLIGHVD